MSFEPVFRTRVIHAHTDAMGIVYHGAVVPWLEAARVEYMRARGLVYADLERSGFGLPVVRLAVDYRSPGRHDDVVVVSCSARRDGRARLRFAYQVDVVERVQAHVPIRMAEAETLHACVRTRDGRPVRLPAALCETLEAC
ncbi:MAG: acyl-CoA thioesterase [Deltaproteobacteria bacterium]|nr:MAG: acyl-CoA thioesterase [Deltaproteobacteria bacterium]